MQAIRAVGPALEIILRADPGYAAQTGWQGARRAAAQRQSIRLKLFKNGSPVRVTVRKVWVSRPSIYPYAEWFRPVYENLQRLARLRC